MVAAANPSHSSLRCAMVSGREPAHRDKVLDQPSCAGGGELTRLMARALPPRPGRLEQV